MDKIVEIAHKIIAEHSDLDIAVDFTCGNGYDTKFLSEQCKQVYAFDVQEVAIEKAKTIAQRSNIEWICDSHIHLESYVGAFDVGVFNLGYLPGGDEKITTNADDVIKALHKAFAIAHKPALLVMVLYPGFAHGKQEADKIESFVATLDSKHFDVEKQQILNRNDAPYIISIKLKGEDEVVPFLYPLHVCIDQVTYSFYKRFLEYSEVDDFTVTRVNYEDLEDVQYDEEYLQFLVPKKVLLTTKIVSPIILKNLYMRMYVSRKRNGFDDDFQSEVHTEDCDPSGKD